MKGGWLGRCRMTPPTRCAVEQHEELTYQHLPGRQAKYLEQPAQDEADVALELVAAQIRRALR